MMRLPRSYDARAESSVQKGTESFGTLLEKVEYNRQHEYLTESREKEDVAYLTQLKKEYGLD